MELNAEQIKTGLVNFSNNTQVKIYYPGGDNLIGDALALIKQLTEENEAWQKQLITTEEQAEKSYYDLACEVVSESHLRHQAEAMLANGMSVVRADTVRAMQEGLHGRFGDDANRVFSNYNIHRYIDQIAKEMLEGDDA